jgi:hypothetical protein
MGGEKATFAELCDGYGLTLVPDDLARTATCCICSGEFKTRKLYTPEPAFTGTTTRQYAEWASMVEQNCYCRYHAIWYYQD